MEATDSVFQTAYEDTDDQSGPIYGRFRAPIAATNKRDIASGLLFLGGVFVGFNTAVLLVFQAFGW